MRRRFKRACWATSEYFNFIYPGMPKEIRIILYAPFFLMAWEIIGLAEKIAKELRKNESTAAEKT